jgi:hydroxysqualene dehydroxylase
VTHVAILGGGYAGLAAAVTLAAQRVPVTVFEAGRQLGGRARRVEYNGLALDNGLHILIGAYRETLRLIRKVNPNNESALLRQGLNLHMHGEFRLRAPRLPAPLHLLAGLLRTHGMSVAERLSAVRFMAALKRRRYALERDISVEQLLGQYRQNDRLCRMLWHPLCVAALNTPPAIACARTFLNVLRDSLDASRDASDLILSRVDLSALFPEPAAAWIAGHGGRVLTGQRVTAVDPSETGFSVAAAGRRHAFSHVICALPPHQVNAFLIGITALADVSELIQGLRYQPIASVWLQYPESVTLPEPMLGFADGLVHWVFDRGRICAQRGLIGAVISAEGTHQELAHDALAARADHELRQHFPGLPAPLWHFVIAEKRATFSCTPGLQRPQQVTPLRNFYLAGDYTAGDYPATLESAVRSGITCANHIVSAR